MGRGLQFPDRVATGWQERLTRGQIEVAMAGAELNGAASGARRATDVTSPLRPSRRVAAVVMTLGVGLGGLYFALPGGGVEQGVVFLFVLGCACLLTALRVFRDRATL